ncbi:alpha/beta-hydrolase [Cyathus striatus]|nr:alpha/beta-hydrolase [Cyathus striatus]
MQSVGTYKTILTSRNLTYGYFSSPPSPSSTKPTLLFLHGYPSSSYDWEAQYVHFTGKGYGVLVPDMLGYGGTDKPLDVQLYKAAAIARDLVDILDKEGVEKVIVVSHDWGTLPASKLINLFPTRILANIFISLSYFPPDPNFDVDALNAKIKDLTGESSFGYWEFFASDDAADVIIKHVSLDRLILLPRWTSTPILHRTDMAPKGKMREWLEGDKMGPGYASYMSPEDLEAHKARFLATGVQAPQKWYLGRVKKVDNEDDALIPLDKYTIPHPTLFVPTLQDYLCLPEVGVAVMKQYAQSLSVKEIDATHWVMMERPGS